MLDAPIEDLYVWVGVAAVSVAVLGVAVGLPSAAPPKAVAVADAVDRVATSPAGATASHAIQAEEIKLDRARIGLRGGGGTARAEVAFGPVTPAMVDDRLERVVVGKHPDAFFESPQEFAEATATARNRTATWRPAPRTLEIRRISWEGVDVVLVG